MTAAQQPTFGSLLRRHRRAVGLTQEELAERAGLSAHAISDLERGVNRAPHAATIELLTAALELGDEDRAALDAAGSRRRGPRGAKGADTRGSLPAAMTRLIGREREVAEGIQFLRWDDVRLLTITGPGGIGKSHLALHIAASLEEHFVDGAAFVGLSSIRDPQLVPSAMAAALGLQQHGEIPLLDLLVASLRDRQMLLLLDNFEQVLEAAPIVADILTRCSGIRMLVTSRESLHLRGAQELPVPPLAVPDVRLFAHDRSPPMETVLNYPSVELFLRHTRAVDPRYVLTREDAAAIGEMCNRLDGLPLAIELAAARMKTTSPQVLVRQLERRLDVLVDGARDLAVRQRTMRNAIAWSYDLLDEEERRLFRRLSVFIGGFDVQAAQAIASVDDHQRNDVAHRIDSLIEKSLLMIVRLEGGSVRYNALETIREYGWERLVESREVAAIQQRHADFFVSLVEGSEPEVMLPDAWRDRLEREHDNIRAALRWALEASEIETGLRLAGAVWRFWLHCGHFTEGRDWIDRLLGQGDAISADVSAGVAAKALYAAGGLALSQGEASEARRSWERSLDLRREVNDRAGIAETLNGLGLAACGLSEYDRADEYLEESVTIRRELGLGSQLAGSLNNLANVARYRGEYARAVELYEESLALHRAHSNSAYLTSPLGNLAHILQIRGEYDRARVLVDESLHLARESGYVPGIAQSLTDLGAIAFECGEISRSREFAEEALDLCRSIGDMTLVTINLINLGAVALEEGDHDRARSLATAALAAGREIDFPRSIAFAFNVLGDLATRDGDLEHAADQYAESLEISRTTGFQIGVAESSERLAHLALLRGDTPESARLYRDAAELRERLGAPVTPIDRPAYERDLAILQEALGSPVLAR